jgi:hypothetical protein
MKRSLLVLLILMPLTGCTLSSTASDFQGLRAMDGSIPTHINSTHVRGTSFYWRCLFKDCCLRICEGSQGAGRDKGSDRAIRHDTALVDLASAFTNLHAVVDERGR